MKATVMNICRWLILIGIVFIEVSSVNAQFGGFGNMMNKALNNPNTTNSANVTQPTSSSSPNDQSATTQPVPNDQSTTTETTIATPNSPADNTNSIGLNQTQAGQAPHYVIQKLSDLVHDGKYPEAQQLASGLLLSYPDDQRLADVKTLLDKMVTAQSANTTSNLPETNIVPGNTATASLLGIKAFKTLNFGDGIETVKHKLSDIVVGSNIGTDRGSIDYDQLGETFWRSLFDTDAGYEPYKYILGTDAQSCKMKSLMHYLKQTVSINVISADNDVVSIECYQLGDSYNSHKYGGLAIVAVSYKTYDLTNLLNTFMQNFPNAQKTNISYSFESTMYPGISIEFKRTFYTDINEERRATLSIPTDRFTFTFTGPDKLPQEKQSVWNELMNHEGKATQLNEYYESVTNAFLNFAKEAESEQPSQSRLDPIQYQGWYDSSIYAQKIYGGPKVVFASKQILDADMNDYVQSIAANNQAEKAKQKKESNSSSGF